MPIKTKPIDKLDNGINGHARRSAAEWAALEQAGLVEGAISEDGKVVSEEEYWANYYDHLDFDYEWNNGVLEVKPMSNLLQYTLYDWFVTLVRAFLEVYPVGYKMALELGFRLEADKHTSVRKPDLFIVRHDNAVALGLDDGSYHGICDLCIESLSTGNRREIERDTKVKKREYALAGVKEYFILDARGEHTAFYRLAALGQYEEMHPDAGVIRSVVLPGFQFRVVDLYRQPALVELAKDEVYRHYVMLDYQQERARAEQEHARAERLAAKLRELGIDEEAL
jgi:Uma2 family endonuclease